jgi:hypothetical protein
MCLAESGGESAKSRVAHREDRGVASYRSRSLAQTRISSAWASLIVRCEYVCVIMASDACPRICCSNSGSPRNAGSLWPCSNHARGLEPSGARPAGDSLRVHNSRQLRKRGQLKRQAAQRASAPSKVCEGPGQRPALRVTAAVAYVRSGRAGSIQEADKRETGLEPATPTLAISATSDDIKTAG